MFKRMVLKRVLGEVQRFENATKKQSIRLSDKQYISLSVYCGIRVVVLNYYCEGALRYFVSYGCWLGASDHGFGAGRFLVHFLDRYGWKWADRFCRHKHSFWICGRNFLQRQT